MFSGAQHNLQAIRAARLSSRETGAAAALCLAPPVHAARAAIAHEMLIAGIFVSASSIHAFVGQDELASTLYPPDFPNTESQVNDAKQDVSSSLLRNRNRGGRLQ
jgi:hypothetical protein